MNFLIILKQSFHPHVESFLISSKLFLALTFGFSSLVILEKMELLVVYELVNHLKCGFLKNWSNLEHC